MRSKRSSSSKELLVDTSFLLPALGIDVEKEIYGAIEKFKKYKIYYLEISLIEAMWSIIKRVDISYRRIVETGLESIRDTYYKMNITPDHMLKAWEIYLSAHKDFIDSLLYSVSIIENIPLLTIDKKLKSNLEKNGYDTRNIVFPKELK